MDSPLPILFDMREVERLHALAYTTAQQSGAKGRELDEVISQIFRSLAKQSNRPFLRELKRKATTPTLRVIEGGAVGSGTR